jgi:pilus assembly protein CpaB
MGAEVAIGQSLSRRLAVLRQDDRGQPQRAALMMLIMAGLLGVAAILLARNVAPAGGGGANGRTVPVVAAASNIGFGETLTPAKLKLIDWPAHSLPKGSFQSIDALIGAPRRAAMRPIGTNEILIASALSAGATRLSTAPLLNPALRAMAVPVNEIAGVAGLLYPGDRVDIFMTRQPDDALPHAELLAQDVRVLAVGADMNIGKDKPEVVKAATLAVTPRQAQKLSLAMATGQISLALRQFSDTRRVQLQSLQVSDLNDGTITRLQRKPKASSGAARAPAAGPPRRPSPATASITVVRGTEAMVQPVRP